jgi:hypothetical protein
VSTPIDIRRFPSAGGGGGDAGTIATGILGALLVALGFGAMAAGLRASDRPR